MEEKGVPLELQELKRKLKLIRKIEQKNTKQMKNKSISYRKESQTRKAKRVLLVGDFPVPTPKKQLREQR